MQNINYSQNFRGIASKSGAEQTRKLASKTLTETSKLIEGITIQTPKKERLLVFNKLCDSYKLYARALCYDIKTNLEKDTLHLEHFYKEHDNLHNIIEVNLAKTKEKGIKTPRIIQNKLAQISSNIDNSIYTYLESIQNTKQSNFFNTIIKFLTRKNK